MELKRVEGVLLDGTGKTGGGCLFVEEAKFPRWSPELVVRAFCRTYPLGLRTFPAAKRCDAFGAGCVVCARACARAIFGSVKKPFQKRA